MRVVLLSLAYGAFALFAFPLFVIQPFKHQDARDLQDALEITRVASSIAAILAICAIITLVLSWRRFRWWSRVGALVLTAVTIGSAALTRVNVFEKMFHPMGTPQFLPPNQSKLSATDMVVAVNVGGVSHAYPIREMGFHHVVNDVVGTTPLVATY